MTTTTSEATAFAPLVRRCRERQESWAQRTVSERLRPVRALRHLLAEQADRLSEAVAADLGKSAAETIGAEVLPLAGACRFLEKEAARILRPRRVPVGQRPIWLWGQSDTVFRRPRGVVGIIGTWNYPILLNGVQIIQALTAGNGVVWKPSEVAPATAACLTDLLGQVGYADDLVSVLPATREAGKELADADINHVVFTGAASTGRVLAAHLGRRLVSSTLELSGCDAFFVLDDADVNIAVRAAWFGLNVNHGQTCLAVRRIFLQRGIRDRFLASFKRLLEAAPPVRLALEAQRTDARRLVASAIADGASCLVEPSAEEAEGSMRPVVVIDARPDMALCREAPFAPVCAVLPFDSREGALAAEAACPFALGAAVFTADRRQAEWFAARLRAGVVSVNDVIAPTGHPATPLGGRGASGWGVTQGQEGLLEMTVPQVVSVRGGSFRPHYDLTAGRPETQEPLVRALLQAGHARTWMGRLRGWRQLAQAGRELRSGQSR